MVKNFVAFLVCLILFGCSMPKKLEYSPKQIDARNINLTDSRRNDEKSFQEKIIGGEVTYFYGDDNFNMPLIDVIKDRLAFNNDGVNKYINITINKITLASSINNAEVDPQAYGSAVASAGAGALPALLARPLIGSIGTSRALRSIWCHIDYSVDGHQYSEKTVGSAKHEDLSAEILNVFLQSLDEIYKARFQSQ